MRHLPLAATALVLALAVLPLADGPILAARDAARLPEPDRADEPGGYYEGLIAGAGGEGVRSELALKMLGKPTAWASFHEVGATRYRKSDFLLFELWPNASARVFGDRFTTNRRALRDRDYALAKPPGTYRIALLGSSIDMGWGVGTDQTYENRFEDWLNHHAARRGISRRFEVLNFAVAAYGPLQRLDAFRRKVDAFEPDLVLDSATMLDTRLVELHLCKLLGCGIDPKYGFVRRAVAEAGLTDAPRTREGPGELLDKPGAKAKLRPRLWGLADDALGELAAECRSRGLPLAMLIVPRAGKADAPDARAPAVARLRGIAARHAVPVLDLSTTFDRKDPAALQLAAWDDHPNAEGHRLLFLALAKALVKDADLYRAVFDAPPPAVEDRP